MMDEGQAFRKTGVGDSLVALNNPAHNSSGPIVAVLRFSKLSESASSLAGSLNLFRGAKLSGACGVLKTNAREARKIFQSVTWRR
jgi:hypothetical protein